MFNVIDGTWNLQFAVERMKKNTRVYAKKQMTWMKKDCDIQWVNIDECTQEEALKKIELLVGK